MVSAWAVVCVRLGSLGRDRIPSAVVSVSFIVVGVRLALKTNDWVAPTRRLIIGLAVVTVLFREFSDPDRAKACIMLLVRILVVEYVLVFVRFSILTSRVLLMISRVLNRAVRLVSLVSGVRLLLMSNIVLAMTIPCGRESRVSVLWIVVMLWPGQIAIVVWDRW